MKVVRFKLEFFMVDMLDKNGYPCLRLGAMTTETIWLSFEILVPWLVYKSDFFGSSLGIGVGFDIINSYRTH